MKRKGFTLIELIAVIVILGIVLLIAIPSFSTLTQKNKEKLFVTNALTYMKQAKLLSTDLDDSHVFDINELTDNNSSPFGGTVNGKVYAINENNKYNYYIILSDTNGKLLINTATNGNGLGVVSEEQLKNDGVSNIKKYDGLNNKITNYFSEFGNFKYGNRSYSIELEDCYYKISNGNKIEKLDGVTDVLPPEYAVTLKLNDSTIKNAKVLDDNIILDDGRVAVKAVLYDYYINKTVAFSPTAIVVQLRSVKRNWKNASDISILSIDDIKFVSTDYPGNETANILCDDYSCNNSFVNFKDILLDFNINNCRLREFIPLKDEFGNVVLDEFGNQLETCDLSGTWLCHNDTCKSGLEKSFIIINYDGTLSNTHQSSNPYAAVKFVVTIPKDYIVRG